MTLNWVDLFLILSILAAFFRGYRAGFIATLFSAIGYIGGALAGLTFSLHLVKNWHGNWSRIGLIVLAIIVGSSVGQALFRGAGKLLHRNLLFGPLKWIDSIAGSLFSVASSLVMLFIFAHLLIVSPWGWAHDNVPKSVIYKKMERYAPSVIKSATDQIKQTFNEINSNQKP
jgi:uncharacterized membrane protein required for colicin V production